MAEKKGNREKHTATELVYREVKRQILACELRPGSLLEEYDILKKLGLSRTPFREACMRLKEEGWLVAMSRRGYLIPSITLQDISDVYELRLILESACVQIAAAQATEKDIEELKEMVKLEEHAPDGDPALITKNSEFHLRSAYISKNVRLVNCLQAVLEHVQRFDFMLYQKRPSTPWITHRDIVEAIKKRDPKQARQRIQEHIGEARQRLFSAFGSHLMDLAIAHDLRETASLSSKLRNARAPNRPASAARPS